MKLVLPLVLVVALASCAKDPARLNVTMKATCRMCAVEYVNDGVTHRDTIIGQINATWIDGNAILDTMSATGTWNVVREDGEAVYLKACRLRNDSADGRITLRVEGDIRPLNFTASHPSACALIDQAVYE
jgi:hypothetical protein